MIKSLKWAAIALLALFVATPVVHGAEASRSVPNFFTGTWHGVISQYPFNDSPQRTLVVTETQGQLRCSWGIYAQSQDESPCSIAREFLNLTTRPGSHIILRFLGGERLEGTFTPKNQRALPLSMGRDPLQNVKAVPVQVCKGEFHGIGSGYYGKTHAAVRLEIRGETVSVFIRDGRSESIPEYLALSDHAFGGSIGEFPLRNGKFSYSAKNGQWDMELTRKDSNHYVLNGSKSNGGGNSASGFLACR